MKALSRFHPSYSLRKVKKEYEESGENHGGVELNLIMKISFACSKQIYQQLGPPIVGTVYDWRAIGQAS